jgi:hypothetical protein
MKSDSLWLALAEAQGTNSICHWRLGHGSLLRGRRRLAPCAVCTAWRRIVQHAVDGTVSATPMLMIIHEIVGTELELMKPKPISENRSETECFKNRNRIETVLKHQGPEQKPSETASTI